jgi:orotate phosphoribosyltransferase-like protein
MLPDGVDFPIIIVRKAGEGSHAGKITAPRLAGLQSYDSKEIRNIVVLDDLVSSGETVMRIVRELNQKAIGGQGVELVRVYTYGEQGQAPRYHYEYGFAIVAIQ